MARGVSKDFINLLFDDATTSRQRIIIVAVIHAALLGLAAWLWWPLGLAVHVGAAALGAGLGWFIGAAAIGRFEDSLRDDWNRWMQLSSACDTVWDLGRKVHGVRGAGRPYLIAGALTLLWALELVMVFLAIEHSGDTLVVASVIAANGLFAGALLGQQIRINRWTKGFATSLAEMVRDGELGVWGVR